MKIFIDCTDTYFSGLNTGIQRVVRNFTKHTILLGPTMGLECTPVIMRDSTLLAITSIDDPSMKKPRHTLRSLLNNVYFSTSRILATTFPFPSFQRFLLAHRSQFGLAWLLFSPLQSVAWLRSLGKSHRPLVKGIEDTLEKGDIFFLPDASWTLDTFDLLKKVKTNGGHIVFFVHDIIPLTHPQVYHPVHVKRFREWFWQIVQISDILICNSHFTQKSVLAYLNQQSDISPPISAVIHLGYDLGPLPSGDIHHSRLRLALIKSSASFLCVGTLEPRKNLDILIDAFEALWNEQHKVSLILIGRAGWLCEDLLTRIRRHPEQGKQLFWFSDVGDTDLTLAYQKASALIFPSIVEGFGLPLVEALRQELPVIASDIPVFREIAGGYAHYFPPHDAQALANLIRGYTKKPNRDPFNVPFQWPTWEASTKQLLTTLSDFSQALSIMGNFHHTLTNHRK